MKNEIVEKIKKYEKTGDFNYAKVSDDMIEKALIEKFDKEARVIKKLLFWFRCKKIFSL